MVTIITKKNCLMFNMKSYNQELELCVFLQRMRKRKQDNLKIVNIKIKETSQSKLKIYKIRICNIEKIQYEERKYQINDGYYIKQMIDEVSK